MTVFINITTYKCEKCQRIALTFLNLQTTTLVRIINKDLVTAAPLAGLFSAFLNSSIFFGTAGIGMYPDNVLINGEPLSVIPIIISSFIPTLLAAAVLALIGRFTKNAWNIFRNLSLVLLILSFANPYLGIPGAPIGMILSLNIMHVVVVGILLFLFKAKAVVPAP